ncbi:MAG: chemotaxis protein CheB [Candidatus Thiodiazotropha sp.]|jgi:two-component system CheB/CheR fusion protein
MLSSKQSSNNATPKNETKYQEDTPVVAVAASAGGLKAFEALLANLPIETGFALVLIQHLDPKHKSMLAELLGRDCRLPVHEITDGMTIQSDHVYIIPPNKQLALLHNNLHFLPRVDGSKRYNPADLFFKSLAEDRGTKSIGVVMSGTASDGTLGCRAIKEAGGITFAQDRESAEYDGMPGSAMAAGCVDFVLPPEEIARELIRIMQHPAMCAGQIKDDANEILAATPEQMNIIFILLRSRTGNDFSYYKATTLKRRISRRMLVNRIDRVSDYIRLMQKVPQEIDALFQDILINVTAFFRDPEIFDTITELVFPKLLEKRPPDVPIRIWVPGCSTGQEAYSFAIVLHEYLGDRANIHNIQVFGSDIDENAVEKARSGFYPESIGDEISQVRLKRYFHKVAGGYQVNKLLRDMCVFAVQNVAKDPPFSRIDFLSCRNLLIYLGATLQKKVLQVFHYALQPGGFLLLGTSESIGNKSDLFAIKDKKVKLYQKKSVASHLTEDIVFRPNLGILHTETHQGEQEKIQVYDLEKEADRMLLESYVPPGIIVNPDQVVVRFLGRTWPYIEPPDGVASLNLYKIAHPDLAIELRAAIHSVAKEGGKVRKENVRFKVGEEERRVDIQVMSLGGVMRGEDNLLVMFEPQPTPQIREDSTADVAQGENGAVDTLVAKKEELEREVVTIREYMQSIVEEQEGTNEELRSANEEIQSTNEELQSTNEELETAKEELQSANEELATVNEELESRNDELARINDDLSNLLSSVHLPILMLDADLRIRQFTKPAQKLLNLIDADIGRPIGNIKPNIELDNLELDVMNVIESMVMKSMELNDYQGHSYSVRIRPYRTLDNRIDGAVIAFIDIDPIKDTQRTKEALVKEQRLSKVVRNSIDAITVQDLEGNIQAWNPAAERIYGYTASEALRLNIEEIVPEEYRQQLHQIQSAIRAGKVIEPLEIERVTKGGKRVKIWLVTSTLLNEHGTPVALATTERLIEN